jgi:hypothetical protein
MFRITCDITIDKFTPFKCTAASWKHSIDNYASNAKIKVPAVCKLKKNGDQYDNTVIPTGQAFAEGMPVEIKAGYDGKNVTRFKGFIKRINYSVPLEIECEGYSYQLRKVLFNKAYKTKTTIKQVLNDLIVGTDIVLSSNIPEVVFEPFTFKNYQGTQLLEFLKEKYLQTVFFQNEVLYVGLRETMWNDAPSNTVNHRLNWNVIKDNELLFDTNKEFATVNIVMKSINVNGTRNKAHSKLLKPGTDKIMKTLLRDATWLKKVADEQKTILNNKGYTGKITAFLEPLVEVGMSDNITDGKYPKRTGLYFIESVEGSISTSGGRQIVGIGNSL